MASHRKQKKSNSPHQYKHEYYRSSSEDEDNLSLIIDLEYNKINCIPQGSLASHQTNHKHQHNKKPQHKHKKKRKHKIKKDKNTLKRASSASSASSKSKPKRYQSSKMDSSPINEIYHHQYNHHQHDYSPYGRHRKSPTTIAAPPPPSMSAVNSSFNKHSKKYINYRLNNSNW